MMRGLMAAVVLASGGLIAGPVVAADAPAYLLSMKLSDGDRLVGRPRLTIRAGEPARIEIRDAQGHGVSMSLTAKPRAGSSSDVDIASIIDVASASGEHIAAKPALMVKLGQPASLAFGTETAPHKPFLVELTVEAAPGA